MHHDRLVSFVAQIMSTVPIKMLKKWQNIYADPTDAAVHQEHRYGVNQRNVCLTAETRP